MPTLKFWAVAFLPASYSLSAAASPFATSVVEYNPGIGFATEFGSGAGFTNAVAALGEPARATPGPFGGPVDAFNPPYLSSQLVSMGSGGSLTVQFEAPVLNSPANPFGIDFLIFGNSGLIITNGNFTGQGITDGTLFGANQGGSRVSVSADNLSYFTLDPAHAPAVDGLYPTDGSGDFTRAVDPSFGQTPFSGQGLEGIRQLYAGSAGGAGYDISWARDQNGGAIVLPNIRFVRVEVLSAASEIDGFAAIPEPGVVSLGVLALALGLALRRSAHRSLFFPRGRRC